MRRICQALAGVLLIIGCAYLIVMDHFVVDGVTSTWSDLTLWELIAISSPAVWLWINAVILLNFRREGYKTADCSGYMGSKFPNL